jgi:membrane dipeptidase
MSTQETYRYDDASSAAALVRSALVWDNVWPLEPWCGNGYEQLATFAAAGWNVLSLTIAGDNHSIAQAFARVSEARRFLLANSDRYVLVQRHCDIETAQAQGKMAVTLHFEGTRCFERNLDVIEPFYALGVRHALLAFNNANSAAGGCMEESDGGLTAWGRRVIAEMERVGMLIDLSHTGRRSSLDALAIATRPMLFTHSNVDALAPHPRNLTNEQIRACAATGGLIGLSGSSGYLGDEAASTESMFRHVDSLVNLVGIDHLAIGFDIVFDSAALNQWVRGRPDEWPMAQDPAWPGFRYAQPQQLEELVLRMLRAGYAQDAIAKFLGGNYLRVTRRSWA